jgi:hypothetical protein
MWIGYQIDTGLVQQIVIPQHMRNPKALLMKDLVYFLFLFIFSLSFSFFFSFSYNHILIIIYQQHLQLYISTEK